MNTENETTKTNPVGLVDYPPWLKGLLIVLSALLVVAAFLHGFQVGNWDWMALLYILSAAILLILPYVSEQKIGKDGIDLNQLQSAEIDGSWWQVDSETGGKHSARTAPRPAP